MFTRSTLAAVILAAFCASVSAVDNCARTYTVVAGDTCDGISAKENVSTFQLATVNAGVIDADCDNLFVGETLCLGIFGQDCEVTHIVEAGDTCESIAAGAGTTVDLVLANNPNVDSACTNIYPGEVLCTADDLVVNGLRMGSSSGSPAATATTLFVGSAARDFGVLAGLTTTVFSSAVPATPMPACLGIKCCNVC